jgi:lipopolysaccharide export system protein LptC
LSWRTALTLFLLVAAVVSAWSVLRHRAPGAHAPATPGRSDYVLHDVDLVVLDETGQESFSVRGPRIARDPAEQAMSLASPVFLLPDSDGAYWQVRARDGWVSPAGDELRLTGDVRVTSPPGQRKVALNTEQLNVFPDRDLATTPAAVTITQPGSILNGVGLETNLATRHYELNSQVHTRHVP